MITIGSFLRHLCKSYVAWLKESNGGEKKAIFMTTNTNVNVNVNAGAGAGAGAGSCAELAPSTPNANAALSLENLPTV